MDTQALYRLMQQVLHTTAQIPSYQIVVERIGHEMPLLPTDRPLNSVDVSGAYEYEVQLNEAKGNLDKAKASADEAMNALLTRLPEAIKERVRNGGILEAPRQQQDAVGARLSYYQGGFVVESY